MKKIIIPLLFCLSAPAFAQLKLYTPEPQKAEAVTGIIHKYHDELVNRWKNEPRIRFIDFDAIQGTASAPYDVPTYDFYAKLFKVSSVDELVMVTCHETGHLLGEITLQQSPDEFLKNFKTSPEGEADFWGGTCVFDYVKEKDLRLSEINPYCKVLAPEEQEHCSYAINLYLEGYKHLSNDEFISPEVVEEMKYPYGNGIQFQHPGNDCRMLTAIYSITGKGRPTCWYNPKS
jgi:hypothetical protein